MIPVRDRLLNLRDLIHNYSKVFVGQTCKNRGLVPDNASLYEEVVLVN